MRARIGFSWVGLVLAGACGGNTLGSGVDTEVHQTGGDSGVFPRAGSGGQSTGREPPGVAGEGEAGARFEPGGAPGAGGASIGGASVDPPVFAGFGGMISAGGGAPAAAGFAAFGGMPIPRSVPVPLGGPVSLDECTYSVDCGVGSFCSCRYACAGDSPVASCGEDPEGRGPDGTWSCELLAAGRSERYFVGGVDMAKACQIVVALAGGEPDYAGPESCTPGAREASATICDYVDPCIRPIVLEDGTMATLGRTRYIGCSEDLCLVDDVAYHADDVDLEDRCEALLPYAEDPPEPVFAEPPECGTTILEEAVGACQTETLCSETAQVAPSVSIEHQEIVHAACESDGNGGSRCACSRDDEALRFDAPWPTTDAAACENARSACEGGFEFTGEVECRQRYVTMGSVFCETMADCSRRGTLADAEVAAIAILQSSCEHDGEAYACRCVSGNQAVQLRVEQPASFEGCVNTVEACRDAVELRYVGDFGSISAPQ
jgi:hypothetical protein